jgi:hypothetical protein
MIMSSRRVVDCARSSGTRGGRVVRAVGAVTGVALASALIVPAGPTRAATGASTEQRHSGLPRFQPAAGTPHFPASTPTTEQIRQLVQCGNTMFAVGSFSVVEQRGQTFTRNNAFSFAATTPFTMTSWNPNVNGVVNSITFNSGHCANAYLGGSFTKIGGKSARNIAEVSTVGAGSMVAGFRHSANKAVETLASYQNHVLTGGFFTTINGSSSVPYMASLDARTGKTDGFLDLHISGHYTFPGAAPNATRIFNQQISHSHRLDLVEGDFTSVGGKRRHQIFMLNLSTRPTATVTSWTSPRFDGSKGYPPKGYYYNCGRHEPFYIRAAAWSADDRTVYLANTGMRPWNARSGFPLRGLCDSAAAFSATGPRPAIKWTNYTGCDSLYSVAADAGAAYFGGHERWSQNANGCDQQGPGAIAAPGMEALDPGTGHLILNSTGTALYVRDRGIGADDMLVTSAGLWIASDNFRGAQMCDSVADLAGICFLPYGS